MHDQTWPSFWYYLLAIMGFAVVWRIGKAFLVSPRDIQDEESVRDLAETEETASGAVPLHIIDIEPVRLILNYRDSDGETERRTVFVNAIVPSDDVNAPETIRYLDGWCELRSGPRRFRLGRIRRAVDPDTGTEIGDLQGLLWSRRRKDEVIGGRTAGKAGDETGHRPPQSADGSAFHL